MNSYELLKRIDLNNYKSDVDLDKTLYLLAQIEKQFTNFQLTFSESLQSDFNIDLNLKLKEAENFLDKVKPREIFKGIESIINYSRNVFVDEIGKYDFIVDGGEKVLESYQKYLVKKRPTDLLSFLYCGSNFSQILKTTFEILSFINEKFQENASSLPSENIINIYFPSIQSYKEFTVKLSSFEKLYLEICGLLNISSKKNPLKILKIESGSLYSKLFGEPRVIKFLAELMSDFISFVHRNYTKEGKIARLPKDIDAINQILGLIERLERFNINADAHKEITKKTSIAVAKNLFTLLAHEPSVEINSVKYKIATEIEKHFIESKNKLLNRKKN